MIHADRNAGARREVVAERAETVREEDRRLVAVLAVAGIDQGAEGLLVERLVDEVERETIREDLRDEAAPDGRVDLDADAGLGVDHADADARVDGDFARCRRPCGLLRATSTRRGASPSGVPFLSTVSVPSR